LVHSPQLGIILIFIFISYESIKVVTILKVVDVAEVGVAKILTVGPDKDTSYVANSELVYTVPYSVAIAVDPS
jgi:hypothetical protein